MKKIFFHLFVIIAIGLMGGFFAETDHACAEEAIRYAGSNQIYKAFDSELIPAFSKATGVRVQVKTSSSGSAFYRLMNGYSDIASIARKLYRKHEDYGYIQIPFCKDPLAVITSSKCGVDNLTESQVQDIFSGDIVNWKEIGGRDLPILVVVPEEDTAANKNFRRQVMRHKEITYAFSAYDSTMAIEAIKSLPVGAVSFIANGAISHEAQIKTVKIDGRLPTDGDYPYFQIFYYVTRGKPEGSLKAFIDFAFSKTGKEIMQRNGMLPLPDPR
ncbi:MAG: substrate-binding domain-containing protein [Deltaproteobacteria bacterium]|nr:substrate-binding domain-containing protein [Deltaproteobacteria bacterium]